MPTNLSHVLLAILGFILWGFFPVYFKQLDTVSPWEIVAHRVIWSFFLLGAFILLTQSYYKLKIIFTDIRSVLLLGLAALFISTNWVTYVYSVLNGYVLEISLAYFISPLFTIMIGLFFFNEKTTAYKNIAIVLCTSALLFKLTFEHSLSHYSVLIAISFSCYGMVKKKILHHSLMAFFIEIGYLFLPALGYLIYLYQGDVLAFTWRWELQTFLLIGLGIITTTPLLLFAQSVKHVDLSLMGFLQYISPFMMFVLAVAVYQETVNWVDKVVFGLIWLAVGLVSYERVKKSSLGKKIKGSNR